jgi:dUTP pyrophosphatase
MMESIFENLEGADGPLKAVLSSLMLPEREFAMVSEHLLNELEKSLNDPMEKLQLVQSLNANGMKAEDLNEVFAKLMEQIDEELKDQLSGQKITFLKRFLGMVTESINATEGIAKRIIPVPIQLCHPDAKRPAYAKAGDAGMDVYAVEDITINPGETVIVPTGIKCALPLGYEFEVRPRSGMSVKTPLRVANAPGTIDSGYRDEIGVIITNTEPKIKDIIFHNDGSIDPRGILYGQSYTITKGMRFAQLVLKEVPTCLFYDVENVAEIGFDRSGGFGSSGVI